MPRTFPAAMRALCAVSLLVLALPAACTSADTGGGGAAASASPSIVASLPEPSPSGPSPSDTPTAPPFAAVEPSVVAVFSGKLAGSGVVYSRAGAVVTNAHLVGTAKTVQIGFADGSRSSAKVVATDLVGDLAVVQVDRANLTALEFTGTPPLPGTSVLAIGSPLGADAQVSQGVVGGVERSVPGAAKAGRAVVGLVRIEMVVGAGQSGAAVVDDTGAVIGLLEVFPGASLTAYVIPAAVVAGAAEQLLDKGKAIHLSFGATLATLTLELSQPLDLGVNEGALLREVTPNSPAAKAGLRAGDVLTAVDGQPVRSAEGFLTALRTHAPGDKLEVERHRVGEGRTVVVTLAELRR